MIIMLLSRLLALVSTQVYMSFYGADNLELNIYSYAIAIPNTIFNCFGTALSTVFIPIYAGHLAKGDDEKAAHFANNIITIASVFTASLIIIGIGLSPVLPKLTSFDTDNGYSFAVKALMIMMPVMLFYGLNYIFQGILQSKGKFGWPAFVSVPSSLVVIGYVFILGDKYGVTGLLVATFIGLSLQAIILIPPAVKAGFRYKPSFKLKDADVINAVKMTLPVLIGVSAYQFNMFFNTTMIARFDGMVTLLTFVQNIVVYMVLAFVYSVTAVVYPKLTASVAAGKMDEYKGTLTSVLSGTLTLLVPVTFGFMTVREPLFQLISNYGKITDADIEKAGILAFMYSIGIIGVGSKEILDRAFYALKDTKLPAINGFIIMGVNVVLSLTLTSFMGAYGIPLAYSVASLTGLAVLLAALKGKIGQYCKGLGTNFVKCLLSGIIMSASVMAVSFGLDRLLTADTLIIRLVKLGVPVCTGVAVYGIMVVILGVDAVKPIVGVIKRKLFKKA